ncbi:MAG: D-sedoheptulose-7-phosphate isomerase [Bdellovibrionota bacterium]|jgi:D-sedoheptulose 7-phosphate isomerase
MKDLIKNRFSESANIKRSIVDSDEIVSQIALAAKKVKDVIAEGGVVYSCGNGGSCCDSMHLTQELVARYEEERKGFKALSFSDPGGLTCWSNDYDYRSAFARYAATFCSAKDVLIGFSTSGNSKNVIEAVQVAKEKGCFTIALTGKDGGKIKDVADIAIIVPAENTARIQESHITIVHILCEISEK